MTIYTVIGYERTTRMMCVEADSQEEALVKAHEGDYSDVDTEPGPLLRRPKWFVSHEGWFHGRR
jgi:hypothetical protein